MGTHVDRMTAAIERVLTGSSAEQVAQYFDPSKGYAADTFNTLGVNVPDCLGPDDLLAVHLLQIDFDPRAVRQLLLDGDTRDDVNGMLSGIDPCVDLWEHSADSALKATEELWVELQRLDGVGPVVAGKILARKRPRLVPIYDKWIEHYLSPPKGEFWETLQAALRRNGLPQRIEESLRPDRLKGAALEAQVSTIRLLDVAIWMGRPR
jgi:hypothetical protein